MTKLSSGSLGSSPNGGSTNTSTRDTVYTVKADQTIKDFDAKFNSK
ncbi:unnamed protein product [Clonostachys solani]|uniref:Uncharacterized protein n=1 Tax=Clonostachys solani TaxID=160281 RepID=A0A9P0EJQ3_9HYPO|nr:unnamed protein product [Clonostachys solani]